VPLHGHADPAFIRKLNSGRNLNDLKRGSTVQVPNVQAFHIETIQPVPDLPPRPEFARRIIRQIYSMRYVIPSYISYGKR
jgi:hypothetical protein